MTADLGPAATTRIPTMEDRMSRPDHIPAPRATGCGHTVDQHHHLAGLEADARSQDRAVLELTAERDAARNDTKQVAADRNVLRDRLDDANALAAFRQGVIARYRDEITAAGRTIADLRQQRDRYVADLADAGNEIDQLTAERDRARAELEQAQRQALTEASNLLWAWAEEMGDVGGTGLRAARKRTIKACARKIAPEPTDDEMRAALAELLTGMADRAKAAAPSLGSPAPTQEPGKPCTGCHACHDDPGTSSPAEADAADAHLGDPAGYEIVATRLYRDRRGQLVSGSVVVASAVSTRPTLVEAVDELRHAISPAEQTED